MLGLEAGSPDLLGNLSRPATLGTALGHCNPSSFLFMHTSFSLLSRSQDWGSSKAVDVRTYGCVLIRHCNRGDEGRKKVCILRLCGREWWMERFKAPRQPGAASLISPLPRYYKCGSPRATFENRFFFSTPNCKYHQFLNTNAIV